MSGIVLSASVRQNLLSLQSTAALLATTQNDLATGNKVNSALDNPTEYFTAQNLNNRASDISNLLDGINNGVQVLQAANTGITSLQSLIASAQSIANQVLQAPTGYSTKSAVTSAAIAGANANNLLGTTGFDASVIESALLTGGSIPGTVTASTSLAGTAGSLTGGAVTTSTTAVGTGALTTGGGSATASSLLSALTGGTPIGNGDTITINGKTINFTSAALGTPPSGGGNVNADLQTDGNGDSTISLSGSPTIQDVLDAIDLATGAQTASVSGTTATLSTTAGATPASIDSSGDISISNSSGTALTIGGTAATDLGLPTTVNPAAALTSGTDLADLGSSNFAAGDSLTVNGKTISFVSTPPTTGYTAVAGGSGDLYIGADGSEQIVVGGSTPPTVNDLLTGIDIASGVQTFDATTGTATTTPGQTASTVNANGEIVLSSSNTSDINITASNSADLKALGLTPDPATGAVTVNRTASNSSLGTLINAGSTLIVDGHTITFASSLPATPPVGSGVVGNVETDGNGNSTVSLSSGSIQDVLNAIDLATGVQTASITGGVATLSTTSGDTKSSIDANGKFNISTGTAQNLTIAAGLGSNNANGPLAALGLTAGTATDSSLQGETLTIAATPGGGTTPTTITFGTNPGQVSTLNQLNAVLMANNLQASIDPTGAITITTSNDAASQTLGALSGTAVTDTGAAFASDAFGGLPPVQDPDSQATRASLVSQYNNILKNITTTAQDSSFNGVNLLNGDTLNMTFDETGASKLSIQGFTFNIGGLGLSTLNAGTDFLDSNSANSVLSQLNGASTTLDAAASALGSNLSVVEIRQDFNKGLVNVLQTGATNLTIADPNEEAANSQALSTRQSIAVSALALANQSQQSVLQLLR